jgi:hypothetical protein
VNTTDIVVVAVGALQAAFLAGAAFAAWRTYKLAASEHQEQRAEARKAPLRGLLGDVVREFKALAAELETRPVGGNNPPADQIKARQRRLETALTFLPHDTFNLYVTHEVATAELADLPPAKIETARGELLTLFARIDDGDFSVRQVAPLSLRAERESKGDI